MSAAHAAHAPDLIEPLIAYRHWRLDGTTLYGPYYPYEWRPGVNAARCFSGGNHDEPAPGRECSCGLYAWYRPCPHLAYAAHDLVGGAVAMWGDVELHRSGLRARYAAIVALVLPFAGTWKRRHVIAAARELEVEAVPARQLKTAALEHGRGLAAGMAPSARSSGAGRPAGRGRALHPGA